MIKLLDKDPAFSQFLDSDAEKQMVLMACPAKVNLCLKIIGRRADGYHNLQSIMVKVGLYDELQMLQLRRPVVRVRCPGHPELENEENLVTRVVRKLLPAGVGLEIHLTKRIPAGAGLGGGSSDAAAAIIGLNRLLKLELSLEKQLILAAEFGADLSFFILSAAVALAEGTGTQLKPLDHYPRLSMVLVHPGFAVPTAWAYQSYAQQQLESRPMGQKGENLLTLSVRNDSNFHQDWAQSGTKLSVQRVAEMITHTPCNDLEPVVAKKHPEIDSLKARLQQTGAMAAWMTGSGSCVVGLYESPALASSAAAAIGAQTKMWSRAVQSIKLS
jgi:4-diphosphocytidyl-2-C-methyl-D-erythritol kinase